MEEIIKRIIESDKEIAYISGIGNGFLYINPVNSIEGVQRRYVGTINDDDIYAPIFPHKIVIISDWDQNALYYNINKDTFPNVEYIILLDNFFENYIAKRFPNAVWVIKNDTLPANTKKIIMTQEETTSLINGLGKIQQYTANIAENNKMYLLNI